MGPCRQGGAFGFVADVVATTPPPSKRGKRLRLYITLSEPMSGTTAGTRGTGDKVDAARCEAIGLVNRVVPDAKLQAEAFALARSMAEGPTIALRYMKDNLDEALLFDFATARDHEAERLIRTTMTADHREAVQAFIEKRKAAFKGN